MSILTRLKYHDQYEQQELSRVLLFLRTNNERDCLLIELALESGAREGELTTISKSDLNPRHQSVMIKNPLKGSNQREIPLSKALFDRLWSYSLKCDDLLFPISTARIRQIWLAIRPYNKSFHSLRHTFAVNQYERTNNLKLVQYLLGHKSLASTGIYLQVEYRVDRLRSMMGL